jgi:hypothetical protein
MRCAGSFRISPFSYLSSFLPSCNADARTLNRLKTLTRPEGRIRLSEDDGPAATTFLGDDDDDDVNDRESRTGAGGTVPTEGVVGGRLGDSNVNVQPSS